jgi:outer membrane protein assembly factor BamB/orotate phosphoribosyltransferase
MDMIVKPLEELRAHILDKGLVFGEYAPGKRVRMMVDTREAMLDGGFLSSAGYYLWQKIKKYNPEVLIGTGYGSINVMLAIQISAEQEGYKLQTLVNREVRKTRNRERLVEGPRPKLGSRAVYVDDLINNGTTIEKTKKALVEEGISVEIVAAAVVFDFWKFGGSRRLEVLGTPVERLFKRHDFGDTREDSQNPKVTKDIAWRHLAHNQWWNEWGKPAPKIAGNRVYFGNDRHQAYCHDLDTGEIIWSYQGPTPSRQKGLGAAIEVVDGYAYISSYDGSLVKIHAETGEIVWKRHLDMFLHSVPYIDLARGQLYIGTEGGIQNARGDIVCLDLVTGTRKWTHPTKQVVPAAPNLIFDMVICGSNDANVYALDPNTGKSIWVLENLGEVKGRVNYINDTILISNQTGKLFGVSKHGEILWTRNCGTSTHHQYLPVHRELGMVYIINRDGMVLAYNETGNLKWARRLRAEGLWNITLQGNELMTLTVQGHLDLIDPATGTKKASESVGTRVRCPCDFNDKYVAINTVPKGFIVYRRNSE